MIQYALKILKIKISKMRIGFASLYPYRPHVKQMAYLVSQAKLAGHDIFFLEMGHGFENCHAKLGESYFKKKIASLKIKYAGLNGFLSGNKDTLSEFINSEKNCDLSNFEYSARSTVASKYGVSSLEDLQSENMKHLIAKNIVTIQEAYTGALGWLKIRNLDLVIGFNGRIDVTNALMQACMDIEVPYYSLERSWTGEGIQLVKNGTALSLSTVNDIVEQYATKPLKSYQIIQAFTFLTKRFSREAFGEYRQWNSDQEFGLVDKSYSWLYTPSSIFERLGHPHWAVEWENDMVAVEFLLQSRSIHPSQLIVRGHPQWVTYSPRSDQLYSDWCAKIGAVYIPSSSKVNTQELILKSDNIISFGSTSAFEAGIAGKTIFNLSPAFYEKGGFIINVLSKKDGTYPAETKLPEKEVSRLCLRALYSINYRYMKLTEEIKAIDNYDYVYKEMRQEDFFEKLHGDKIFISNEDYCDSTVDEDNFLDAFFEDVEGNLFNKAFFNDYKAKKGFIDVDVKSDTKDVQIKRVGLWKVMDMVDRYVR